MKRWLLLGALLLPLACGKSRSGAPELADIPPAGSVRWVGTPGGGAQWLPRDERHPDDDGTGSIYGVSDGAGVASVIKQQGRAAISLEASHVCEAVPALVKARDRMSLDLNIMSKADDAAAACVKRVRPRAFSFVAERPLTPPLKDLLMHLDQCEALGAEFADDELALLLASRDSYPDGEALRSVTLAQSTLSARGVLALASHKKLRSIGLRGLNRARPQDGGEPTGLAAFGALPELERLDLSYGPVTDDDLAAFSGARALRWLMLESTEVTDAGIIHLSGLTDLTSVNLASTKVGDRAVVALAGAAHLTTLRLTHTAVTDRGALVLGQMKTLQRLDLALTKVTDEGLGHLANLPSLRELTLPKTVTAAATARWKMTHPKMQVLRDEYP